MWKILDLDPKAWPYDFFFTVVGFAVVIGFCL